ncbi:MAG: hypothetical protein HYX67_16515, partial [Candidatus Melainabacteria bacterium]|nr:hypothetical protein [Candidatus Melainabacteria bacterium]
KVYFWDHEREADPDQGQTPETAGNVHLIADSFSEFLDGLFERPVPEGRQEGEVTTPPEYKGRLEALMKRKGMI